jgi:hypothetical protein
MKILLKKKFKKCLVAVNALLDIWTQPTQCGREWVAGVSKNITTTIEWGVNFLINFLGSDTGFPLENAFFSGADKGYGRK